MRLVSLGLADDVWINPTQVVRVFAIVKRLKYVDADVPSHMQQTGITLSTGQEYVLDWPLDDVLSVIAGIPAGA